MKIVKPLNLSLIYKVYENKGQLNLVVSVISFFSFAPVGKLGSEVSLWKFVTEELGKGALLDMGMPKPRAEILVNGTFYSPHGKPVRGGRTRVQFGSMEKEIHVFGDRQWERHFDGSWTITDPTPITSLPLTYENAYGGVNFAKNPVGKGHFSSVEENNRHGYPVPNIVDPHDTITSPNTEIEPAGFCPYDLIWPQRFNKLGTYDQQWLKELFPGFARDFDATFFNTAPVNQQFNGFFSGDETFVCENMHPEKSVLASQLPGIIPRSFINQIKNDELIFQEVPLQLDTTWLFPSAEKGVLIHRGIVPVADDQARDVEQLLLVYERFGGTNRSTSHYEEALDKRMDPEKDYLYALKEDDLIPDGDISGFKELMEETGGGQGPSLMEQHALTRKKREVLKAKEEFEARGLETGDIFDQAIDGQDKSSMVDLDNLDVVVEDAIQMAEDSRAEMEKEARELAESLGLDYNQMASDAQKNAGGRIEFPAAEISEQLKKFGNHSPEKEEQLRNTEREFDTIYRKHGHHGSAAIIPSLEKKESMRAEIQQRYSSGEDLTGLDFTGVDLSGMVFDGINLSKTILEGANLSGTTLRRAKLTGCMLARANLRDSVFEESLMKEVNMGHADLSGARFLGCNMEEAVLCGSIMENAHFRQVNLKDADCMECQGDGVVMQDVDLTESRFIESKLNSADFSTSILSEALFLKAELHRADFTEADLASAIFVQSQADDAVFVKANLTNLRAVMEISFQRANFSNSTLIDANLRGANLEGANFTESNLSTADLSESNLKGCCFYRAQAKQTMFMKADLRSANMVSINLFEGSLQGARLENVDLRGANLFAADLLKTDFNSVRLEQANLGRTLLEA